MCCVPVGLACGSSGRPGPGGRSPPAALSTPANPLEPAGEDRLSAGRAFRTGLTTNLLNPKIGVFYLSVMPAFLPAGLDPLAGALALGAIHVAEGIVWLGLIVLVVNRARAWLTRPRVTPMARPLCGRGLHRLRRAASPGASTATASPKLWLSVVGRGSDRR